MEIRGSCHCGNIAFVFDCPLELAQLPVRACTCTFCRKHGGVWTSCSTGSVTVAIQDAAQVTQYGFGTKTAAFHTCRHCGVVPIVTSEIDGRMYAVVSVNAFDDVDTSRLTKTPISFDGEGTDDRLARRKRNWIGHVRLVS